MSTNSTDNMTDEQRKAARALSAAREAYRTWAETIADALLDGELVWSDDAMASETEIAEDMAYGRDVKRLWKQRGEEFLGTLTPFIMEPLFELDGRIGA